MATRRPNVVWVCADDFNPDFSGTYGHPVVRTPNLDRLAARGLRFDRAYAAAPLSTPSRQAFWTGRYPRSIGVTLSPTPLPADEITLPTLLRRAGYEVAAFGKTHFYRPRRHEFDLCVDWPDYHNWLAGQGRTPLPPGVEALGPWRPFYDPPEVWLNAACRPYPAVDAEMFGTYLAGGAARFLASSHEKPFFLYVSFHETHSPFNFPAEFVGRYDPRDFNPPRVSPDAGARVPAVFARLTDAEKRGIRAAYATSAEFMDKNLGIVLDALARSPHAANTLVIFTSDHGYMLGHQGRFEKHCCYEPAVRAALVVSHPTLASPGRATSALAELIDSAPTVLELCGVPVPSNVQGRGLTALLAGRTDLHRDHVICEYAGNEEAAIRTDRWKLIYATGSARRRDGYAPAVPLPPGPSVKLFDLEADPVEGVNLAGRAEHRALIEKLLGELADHARRTAREPLHLLAGTDARAVLAQALVPRDRYA